MRSDAFADQGIDTIRPDDNGFLCGGGAFETKGCAASDCSASAVNNGGSDGIGSVHVTIDNVRLNDYHYAADRANVGASIVGNSDCACETCVVSDECCFCQPNAVRSTQVGIWVPATRNAEGTQHLRVSNVVASSTQGDGINLHGYVREAVVERAFFQNSGDDTFAVWGASLNPENVTFADCIARNPGILRPRWYGNCVATYGVRSVVFDRMTCAAPTIADPIATPGGSNSTTGIGTSMFVVHTSFGASHPEGHSITIRDWTFEDLQGNAYTPAAGTMGEPGLSGRKAWSTSPSGVVAPYYTPTEWTKQRVNVVAGTTHETVTPQAAQPERRPPGRQAHAQGGGRALVEPPATGMV